MPVIAPENIATAIHRALQFVQVRQRPDGCIQSNMLCDRAMIGRQCPDSSVFTMMWVACYMGFTDRPEAAAICENALCYLESYAREPGIWHYFTVEHHTMVDADLDDTARYAKYQAKGTVP